mgnify:CR=1 FL=1
MSNHTLSTDHSATMKTSHGITLNTNQSFVPYNINVVPSSEFEISNKITSVTYTGTSLNTFLVSQNAELNTLSNAGTIGNIVNRGIVDNVINRGTIATLVNGSGKIGTITDINGTTTITKVSGSIVIPSKSSLTGSIVFGGDNGSSDVTLKYDSAKGCMVFTYE